MFHVELIASKGNRWPLLYDSMLSDLPPSVQRIWNFWTIIKLPSSKLRDGHFPPPLTSFWIPLCEGRFSLWKDANSQRIVTAVATF